MFGFYSHLCHWLDLNLRLISYTFVPANSACNMEDAENAYNKGVEFLTLGKPSKAIPFLQEALKLNFGREEVKSALSEARSGLMWSSPKFCSKCKKLLEPISEYPYLKYENFCPRCGETQSFDKEEFISVMEFSTKLIFFGVYILLLLIFCAIPNLQLTLTGIWYLWNPLVNGVFLAISFSPIVVMFFVLINDPWGSSLSSINLQFFAPLRSSPPLYLAVSILLLLTTVYLYFFFLLTPFLAVHRKRTWISVKHQKKLLMYTSIFCGFIIFVRMACGVFY